MYIMSSLSDTLSQQLASRDLSLQDWKLLVQRLLDYGVLCRDDSQVEAEFYDQFVRIEPLVDDYLSLIGVRFQHDKHFHYVRLIPPGARLAGVDDENDEPYNGGFRQRLSQHEVAMVLVLRAEYDKALREGAIDEQGCTAISLEAITLSMKNLLKRALPEQMVERRQVFKKLRQLRLIHFVNEADLDQGESWIKIRPLIVNLVSNEWLEAIRQDAKLGNHLLSQSQADGEPTDTPVNVEDAEQAGQQAFEETNAPVPVSTETSVEPEIVARVEVEKKVATKKTATKKAPVIEPLPTQSPVKLAPAKTTSKKPVAAKAVASVSPAVKKATAKKVAPPVVAKNVSEKPAKTTAKAGKPVATKQTAVSSKPTAKKAVGKKSTAKSISIDAES